MKNLSKVGVRLLAIYILIQALANTRIIPALLFSNKAGFNESFIYMHLFMFILYGLGFVYLFLRADNIANRIMPDSDDIQFQIDNYQKLASVLFASVGILITFWALDMLSQSLGMVRRNAHPKLGLRAFEIYLPLLGGIIQLIVGLFLFFRGKKIAAWWYKVEN